jgi:hypothetical protein
VPVDPASWRYDHDLQAAIIPDRHPELRAAMELIWRTEIPDNLRAIALHLGVDTALQAAIGATITFICSNEEPTRWMVEQMKEDLRERPDHHPGPGSPVRPPQRSPSRPPPR